MVLSSSQLATLKTDVQSDGVLNAIPHTADGWQKIADAYNVVGTFVVWRTSVPPTDYRGQIVWTEVSALSVGLARIWEWVSGVNTLPINAADPNVRTGIATAFAGLTTLTNLTAVAKRFATRGEKLFATGTGTSGSPGTMGPEGVVTAANIQGAFI